MLRFSQQPCIKTVNFKIIITVLKSSHQIIGIALEDVKSLRISVELNIKCLRRGAVLLDYNLSAKKNRRGKLRRVQSNCSFGEPGIRHHSNHTHHSFKDVHDLRVKIGIRSSWRRRYFSGRQSPGEQLVSSRRSLG